MVEPATQGTCLQLMAKGLMVMEAGFIIQCLKCGHKEMIKPGRRNREAEKITFGTTMVDEIEFVACCCGNAIEENYYYDGDNSGCELVEEWRVKPSDKHSALEGVEP